MLPLTALCVLSVGSILQIEPQRLVSARREGKGWQTQPNRISNIAPKGRNTTAQGSALGLALLAKQALKGRYKGIK